MPEVETGGGGGGALTDLARIVGSHRDVQNRGGSTVSDVEVISVETIGHGIYFERAVPYASFQENGFGPLIAPIATAIEYALDNGFADDALYVQEVTAAGLIEGAIDFYVSVPGTLDQPGPFSTIVRVTVQSLYDGASYQTQINQAKQQLKAAAGL